MSYLVQLYNKYITNANIPSEQNYLNFIQ